MMKTERFNRKSNLKIRFHVKICISGFSEDEATADPNSDMAATGWCCKGHSSGKTHMPQFTGGWRQGPGLLWYRDMVGKV